MSECVSSVLLPRVECFSACVENVVFQPVYLLGGYDWQDEDGHMISSCLTVR